MQSMEAWSTVFWISCAVLLYVHFGYPLLMALCACLPRRARQPVSSLPRVSLIFAAHNEEEVIEHKLRNALAIDYPLGQLEILVGGDGCTDRTVELARHFECQGVRVLDFASRRGKPSVLNDLVDRATGDILLLCDANVMFRPDALRHLASWFADPNVGMVTGDVRLASHESSFGEGESLYYRIERAIQLGESRVGSVMGVDGGMYAQRRQLFRPLLADSLNEEFANTMQVIRQGKRVVYEPMAVASEGATPTARHEFQRRIRVMAGAVRSLKRREWPSWWRPVEMWQYISHKVLRWMGPVWLVALLVANIQLWNEGSLYQAAAVGQTVGYLGAMLGAISDAFRRTRLGGIPFYFVMSHLAMAVGVVKGLFNLQPVVWARTERVGHALPQ